MSGEAIAKLPNSMTKAELMMDGKTEAEASQIMHQRVFGTDVQFKDGKPVEKGKGSEAQPTPQHVQALQQASDVKLQKGGAANANVIAEAIAAGIALAEKRRDEERL